METMNSAAGKKLPVVTGEEDISTINTDMVKGVACTAENRDKVKNLIASAANRITDSTVFRGISVRGKNDEMYTVFAGFKSEIDRNERVEAQKKLYK
jgi:hypothetical protein